MGKMPESRLASAIRLDILPSIDTTTGIQD